MQHLCLCLQIALQTQICGFPVLTDVFFVVPQYHLQISENIIVEFLKVQIFFHLVCRSFLGITKIQHCKDGGTTNWRVCVCKLKYKHKHLCCKALPYCRGVCVWRSIFRHKHKQMVLSILLQLGDFHWSNPKIFTNPHFTFLQNYVDL